MLCRKCKTEIPDISKFCLECGAKQGVSAVKSRRRRGNGMGTVYKTKSGKYQAEVVIGKLPNGRPDRRTKGGFERMKDAYDYIPELRKKPRKGVDMAAAPRERTDYSQYTFAQLYEKWKPRHEKRVSKGTMGCYTAAYNHHLADLYPIRFTDLTTEDFQICVDDCTAGKRTRQDMKALGSLLYGYAYELGITEKNYAQFIYIGRMETESRLAFTDEHFARIMDAAKRGVPYAEYVTCMCYLGYRPTEFLDLSIDQYDADLNAFIGGMKTEAGKTRIIPVSPKIAPFVKLRIATENHFIFPDADGRHMDHRTFRETIFYPLLSDLGIQPMPDPENGIKPTYTLYSCRRRFATMMKKISGPAIDKAALMGHTSYEMTMKYQDKDIDTLRTIINAM